MLNKLTSRAGRLFAETLPPDTRIGLLPGRPFFTSILEIPPGMKGGEFTSFLELSLESMSPFGLNQLYYGYCRPVGSSRVLLYAAYRKSFSQEEAGAWVDFTFVIPAFVTAIDVPKESDMLVCVEFADSLSVLSFNAGEILPSKILSSTVAAMNGDEEKQKVRDRLCRTLQSGAVETPCIMHRLTGVTECLGNQVFFSFEDAHGAAKRTAFTSDLLRRMDVREKRLVEENARRNRHNHLVWRSVATAAVLLVLLLFGEAALYLRNAWVDHRDEYVTSREAQVQEVESQADLANRIEDITESYLYPFSMLDVINRDRPPAIYFTRALTDGLRGLVVDAASADINAVDQYVNALRNHDSIVRAEVRSLRTRGGQSTFTLVLTFRSEFAPASEMELTRSR